MLHPRQIAVISKAFEMWRKNFAHFIQSLLPHINRWGSLKLREIDIFQFEMLQILPAPRLETLHISDIGIGRELTNAPHILFGERTPRLRDLSLTGVAIPLTSPVYSGLTRLQLASIHFIESSLPRLVESLAACPHLESLSLDTVEFPPLTMFGTHFVVLERLDFLRLGRLDRAAERFIFTAILPCPSLRLEMNSSVHAQDCGIFPPEAPLGILDTLQRSHQRIHSLEIHAHPTALSIIGRNKMYGEALFTLYFPDCGTSCLAKILPNLSPYIPFSQLEALTLYGLDERKMSTEEFGDIVFRRFPIVKVLALVSCTPSFLDAITITPVSLLFPLLQTLRLVNMHVSGATVAVVESRMRQGHHFRPPGLFYPLQHVVLSNCYGEVRARIPELRELVDLDWS
ncbi:hypothetical protein BOTBODRAFT_48111 [Botryobasidium botryosum FD-172 SS1]|uniref:F-box domain-containing protein n=1 Tax=Botryobasidium botryosum (strain FD-172 SS1) TaxID=930990 RepID=A0A067M1R5_BOTB1|nr:hypothetical protein BOTBODRAFT_48111 [Botryobasidium botryosum FD-172 SS1]